MMNLFRKEAVEHQRAKLWGDVIIVQPTSHYWVVAVFMFIFVVAAIFLASQSYARKETVAGYLSPESGLSQSYALRGGVIEEVLVTPGQPVTEGQPLVRLRTEQALPDGQSNIAEAQASLAREITDTDEQERQANLRYETELEATQTRIKNQRLELDALKAEQRLLSERIDLATKQRNAAQDLAKKGHAATRTVEERTAALLTLRQTAAALKRQEIALTSSIADNENHLGSVLPSRRDTDLIAIRQRRESLLRQMKELELAGGYAVLAPVSGVVADVLKKPGANASPASPLITIRPHDSPLVAKLVVPSRAVGLLAEGQTARIQYDAFPYQRFGVFAGTVMRISEGVLMPGDVSAPIPMQEAFYLVDVALQSQSIKASGKTVPLKSGMLLKADITLEKRPLVAWIFDPIIALKGKL